MEISNNTTFIKITNKDIYSKLCDVETHVIKTNGKVKLNKWMSVTALSLSVGTVLALINFSLRGLL